jgi:serine/threonine-protein kinase
MPVASVSFAPMIGTTFADYSILEKINRGGMADIYLATDRAGNRYTLRVLLPHLRFHWREVRRFRWGCEVMSRLNHPNVIHLRETGKFRGLRYAVLEYVDGPNLKERILRGDPLLRANQLKLLIGMASALAHVHERGFIHLDFKPENVIVPNSYEPKLVDFDLAIPRPARPKRARILSGTLAYLAPEQMARQPVDERADIFAFGVTAYEMLTGKKPVAGNSREEILKKYAEFDEHMKPPRAHIPDVPHFIERVILKCLEKDVMRRYPSMTLVVRDLQT